MNVFHHTVDKRDDDIRIILRKETCKNILVFLLEKRIANFIEIQDVIEKSSSTTSLAIKTLTAIKLIKKTHGSHKEYSLEDPEKIAQIMMMPI